MHRDETSPGDKADNEKVTPAWRDRSLLQKTYIEAARGGMRGVTWYEVSSRLRVHHGNSSGALSTLHKQGTLARLCETRGGCSIYVTPSSVGLRETIPYGGKPKSPDYFIERLWKALKAEGVDRDIAIELGGYHLGVRFRMPGKDEEVVD